MQNPSATADSDPELEALILNATPAMQEQARGLIERVRPLLSAEEWKTVRDGLVNDLKFQQKKDSLEGEMDKLGEKMDKLQKSLDELKDIKKGLDQN